MLFYLSKIVFSGFPQFKGNFVRGQNTLKNTVNELYLYLKKEAPALFDVVLAASEVQNYNTRHATNQNLYRQASRTNYGLARFRVTASKICEKMPVEMKCLPRNASKNEYKLFFLSNQT